MGGSEGGGGERWWMRRVRRRMRKKGDNGDGTYMGDIWGENNNGVDI